MTTNDYLQYLITNFALTRKALNPFEDDPVPSEGLAFNLHKSCLEVPLGYLNDVLSFLKESKGVLQNCDTLVSYLRKESTTIYSRNGIYALAKHLYNIRSSTFYKILWENCKFYFQQGMFLDEQMELMCMYGCRITWSPGKIFLTPVFKIRKDIYISPTNSIEKFLVKKLMKFVMGIDDLGWYKSPYNPPKATDDSIQIETQKMEIVIADDIGKIIKPAIPNIETNNQDLVDIVINNFDGLCLPENTLVTGEL